MKKVIQNNKNVMIAIAVLFHIGFFIPTKPAEPMVVVEVTQAEIKQLNATLLKLRANMEALYTTTHRLLSHEETKPEQTQTTIKKLYTEMIRLQKQLSTKNSLFVGVKNMAAQFAMAESLLLNALKANSIIKLVEAIDTINTTSINALERQLHGPQGLFAQFKNLEDPVLAEILRQITTEIDKLTQMDPKDLGHSSEIALIEFLKRKGLSGDGVMRLLNKTMAQPKKLTPTPQN